MDNFLRKAAQYTTGEHEHQNKAWDYLEENTEEGVLEDFKEMYRSETDKDEEEFYAEHPITKRILKRLIDLDFPIKRCPKAGHYMGMIIGISGMNRDFKKTDNKLGFWNDVVMNLRVWDSGLVQVTNLYTATTEPGEHYTKNPMNRQGAAMVQLDSYNEDVWQIGYHFKQSNCLIQTGNGISVVRDSNRNGKRDANEPINAPAYIGINLHSTRQGFRSNRIHKFSAGCCVVKSVREKNKIVNEFKKSYDYKFGNKKCSYILLDGSKL